MNKSSRKDKSRNAELMDSNNREDTFCVKIVQKDGDNKKSLVKEDANIIMSFISKEKTAGKVF